MKLQLPPTITSNDTRACYDWISASLALQRVRLSAEAVYGMTNALQSVTNDINTVFGVSMMQYFSITPPFQGSRQCNGEGPIIWVKIGTILLIWMLYHT